MKRKVCFLLVFVFMFILMSMPIFAKNNDWVMDEPSVLKQETLDYITNLNENVYTTYKNKPQLGIVIVNELPSNISMDEYKLDLFNDYGVGTKEENCGMLFVFSISDREYGFEIGDGYKKGSLLRQLLEEDFVNDDIKDLLRNENYDAATMEIVKHIDNIMQKEESGVVAAKEKELKEKERLEQIEYQKQTETFLNGLVFVFKIIMVLSIIGIIIYGIYFFYITKTFFKNSNSILDKNRKLLVNIGYSSLEKRKALVFDCWRYNIANKGYEKTILEFIYNDVYLNDYKLKIEEKSKSNELQYDANNYLNVFGQTNSYENFLATNILSLNDIIKKTDDIIKKKEEIISKNRDSIFSYIDSLDSNSLNVDKNKLKNSIESYQNDYLYSQEEIEKIVKDKITSLEFDECYDKFLRENEDKINSRHFDKTDFRNQIRKNPDYKTHGNSIFSNPVVLMLLLTNHINSNEEHYREEQRSAARRREEESRNNSSFGGGFGGGFSSGGGFSGGW